MISWPSPESAVVKCRTGRARAACQRLIESGKSEPQLRKLSITAGCLCSATLKVPKSAESPVSLVPKKIWFPCGCRDPASAAGATARKAQRSATAARAARLGKSGCIRASSSKRSTVRWNTLDT
jgi:hypothetical protein